jgi:hypothetical protein
MNVKKNLSIRECGIIQRNYFGENVASLCPLNSRFGGPQTIWMFWRGGIILSMLSMVIST